MKKIVSATYAIDNSNDSARQYDISAEVAVKDGRVSNIANGSVKDSDGTPVADFDKHGNLRCSVYPETERVEVFTAINKFVTDINSEAASISIPNSNPTSEEE